MTNGVPDGFHTVQVFHMVPDVGVYMDFLLAAFDGTEIERVSAPDGTVMHGEVRIGDSVVMIGSACNGGEPTKAILYLYVPDADAAYERAMAAGAVSHEVPTDQFYGDRVGTVYDAHGNMWCLATRRETLSEAEIEQRMAQAAGGAAAEE